MTHIYDLETYPNLFVGVWKTPGSKEYRVFYQWEIDGVIKESNLNELRLFCNTNPKPNHIGYNNLHFDAPVLEYILGNDPVTCANIKAYANKCIEAKWSLVPEWQLKTVQIDLYKIWHYDNPARYTSLKWLEYMFNMKKIKDLPYHHTKQITSKNQVDAIIKYCKHDVDVTDLFFEKSKSRIIHRQNMSKKFNMDMMNKSDASMGESLLIQTLCDNLETSKKELKSKTGSRWTIHVKDEVFNYYWKLPITTKIKEEYFDNIILVSLRDSNTNKYVFDFKSVPSYTYQWGNMEVVYGMGGIHGCVPKGVYESNDDTMIMSCDVTSEYPNLCIQNNIYPEHIGPDFVRIYRDNILQERKKWPKKTHFMLNQMYKLAANSAYGKFNSQYSALYDPKCSVAITVNGQLSKTLLAEMLIQGIPGSELLMMNTDGLEIRIDRKYENLYKIICDKWEEITKLNLEHEVYNKLIIESVNHYIGEFTDGTLKRKGRFYLHEDYSKYQEYHKNASATIIPEAVHDYFIHDIDPSITIKICDNIFKFCLGAKKTARFTYVTLESSDSHAISVNKYGDRVLRYFIAKHPLGKKKNKIGSLFKLWDDGRLTALQKNALVQPLQILRSTDISKYKDNIDYQWYIDEAEKIISSIENYITV